MRLRFAQGRLSLACSCPGALAIPGWTARSETAKVPLHQSASRARQLGDGVESCFDALRPSPTPLRRLPKRRGASRRPFPRSAGTRDVVACRPLITRAGWCDRWQSMCDRPVHVIVIGRGMVIRDGRVLGLGGDEGGDAAADSDAERVDRAVLAWRGSAVANGRGAPPAPACPPVALAATLAVIKSVALACLEPFFAPIRGLMVRLPVEALKIPPPKPVAPSPPAPPVPPLALPPLPESAESLASPEPPGPPLALRRRHRCRRRRSAPGCPGDLRSPGEGEGSGVEHSAAFPGAAVTGRTGPGRGDRHVFRHHVRVER